MNTQEYLKALLDKGLASFELILLVEKSKYWESYREKIKQEIKDLKAKIKEFPYEKALPLIKQRKKLESTIQLDSVQTLDNTIPVFSESVAKLDNQSAEFNNLVFRILNIPRKTNIILRCDPIFRDAIIFYNQNQEIISILNICFECQELIDSENERIECDAEGFKQLESFIKAIIERD